MPPGQIRPVRAQPPRQTQPTGERAQAIARRVERARSRRRLPTRPFGGGGLGGQTPPKIGGGPVISSQMRQSIAQGLSRMR